MFGISGAALIIIAIAIVTPSVGWWYSSNELRVCTAEYEGFQETTRAKGSVAESERISTEKDLAQAAVNIQGDLNAKQIELNRVYAEYDRLRRANKGGAGGSKASSLADRTRGLSCPDRGGEFAAAMGRLEDGVIPILKSRDEAINRTIACKAYLDELQRILHTSEGQSHVILSPK